MNNKRPIHLMRCHCYSGSGSWKWGMSSMDEDCPDMFFFFRLRCCLASTVEYPNPCKGPLLPIVATSRKDWSTRRDTEFHALFNDEKEILRRGKFLLSAFGRESAKPMLKVDFWEEKEPLDLDGLFMDIGVKCMLESKESVCACRFLVLNSVCSIWYWVSKSGSMTVVRCTI